MLNFESISLIVLGNQRHEHFASLSPASASSHYAPRAALRQCNQLFEIKPMTKHHFRIRGEESWARLKFVTCILQASKKAIFSAIYGYETLHHSSS
jgi:hypothetical protein